MAKVTLQSLKQEIDELREELEEYKKARPVRDRGPNSTREMTDDDARKIMLGDLKNLSHRKAAEELGLSYGQVYSARNGYTFKGVYHEMKEAEGSSN